MDSSLIIRDNSPLPEAKRLVVLVPDADFDETKLARRIWALASIRETAVLFLTLVQDGNYLPGAHRRLATLAAITRDARIAVEKHVSYAHNWTLAVREVWQTGDLLVCYEGQTVPQGFFGTTFLVDLLTARLHHPVYLMSGGYQGPVARRSKTLVQMVYWLSLILILVFFFAFEIDVDRLTTGWINSIFSIFIFALEISLIWIWNSIKN
ncbi:MAG: hypothetical protein M1281_08025 [Chloroflexi bacterium]|nr:hypothetical protein [Chloroflexota bacterium]